MASDRTQANRVGEIVTPLGRDRLLLVSFTASEALSEPFEIVVECLSEDGDLDLARLIGRNSCLKLKREATPTRFFSGVCVEAAFTDVSERMQGYQLVLRPWLWLLTQASDNRIFQHRSVLSIIRKVFRKAGFPDYEIKTTHDYAPIDYCVQYGETHFNFVSRLMQQFGIYYYFRHTEDKHILVLADARGSHEKNPHLPAIRYMPYSERSRDTTETLNIWRQSRKFRTGKVTLAAFDFDKPGANMQVERLAPGGYAKDKLEHYGYPGLYKQPERDDLGRSFARTQIEAMQAQDRRRSGEGDLPHLAPGWTTALAGHPGEGENIEYLVVSARHHFQDASYASAQDAQGGVVYQGSYEFQPAGHPYKAPSDNAKPTINGPQTATVTGPAGEEIHTDRHGRIKVQFHWDRLGKRDDKSSRWVRVAQMNWSGGTWGGMAIPRIGMEVVVEFIEGDPDRPLVTGTVFNGANTVPYPLPQNKTRMTIKSKTYKGMGFNELRFEDEMGREEIFVHAQKDMNTVIENDETRVVREDRLTRISKNEIVQIGGDHSVYVKNTHVVSVGGDYHQYVGGSVKLPSVEMPFATADLAHEKLKSSTSYYKALPDVSGNGNYQLTVKGNYHILTKKNYRMESHGTNVMSSGSETLIGSGKKLELHSGSNLHVIASGDMQIHSMSSILIKCGNASISMTKDGIVKLKGVKVLIN